VDGGKAAFRNGVIETEASVTRVTENAGVGNGSFDRSETYAFWAVDNRGEIGESKNEDEGIMDAKSDRELEGSLAPLMEKAAGSGRRVSSIGTAWYCEVKATSE
jgi:hypothetical protein